jgi:hypothetical protein
MNFVDQLADGMEKKTKDVIEMLDLNHHATKHVYEFELMNTFLN